MTSTDLDHDSGSRPARLVLPPRVGPLGEASLIAGITALAYLVALAYRIGALVRVGLPISLATVRLSDAALAGLFVLVGGFFAFAVTDIAESWQEGTLEKVWIWLMIGLLAICAFLFAIFVLVFLVQVVVHFGIAWSVVIFILLGLTAALIARMMGILVPAGPGGMPKMKAFAAILSRHPGPAIAVLTSVFLCLGAFTLGSYGTTLTGRSYLRVGATDEVVVGLSEDRAVLAEATFEEGGRATLTGGFRVVALPSTEITFSAQRVRELAPPHK